MELNFKDFYSFEEYSKLAEIELVEKNKVAVIPISAFYHDGFDPKILRFCFAKTEDTIVEASKRFTHSI